MATSAETRGERSFLFRSQDPPTRDNPHLFVQCEFQARQGWSWAATLTVKGARSAHEYLSFPREVMARQLPRNPGVFILVEKRREWSRRHVVSREEIDVVFCNLKKLSEQTGAEQGSRNE